MKWDVMRQPLSYTDDSYWLKDDEGAIVGAAMATRRNPSLWYSRLYKKREGWSDNLFESADKSAVMNYTETIYQLTKE